LSTLGIPIVITQLLQVSYGFVAIVMVGRVGALELAAIGLGTSLWIMVQLAKPIAANSSAPTRPTITIATKP
jgi:Na+-driven multidrug efflux pump